jgi:hypothetical protein
MLKFNRCALVRAGSSFPLAAGAAFLLVACAPVGYVQAPGPAYVQGPPSAPRYYPEVAAPQAPGNSLDQLMAPVALYPDPLISLILPASAFGSDIAAAGAYLNAGGDPGQVDTQPWDQSVRSLAHYPDVVKWMAKNASWTQTVGAAFVADPAAVMQAIQRLRALARAAGTLVDTSEQQVVADGNYVEIEPAQPGVIYVPRYDPDVVFVDQPYYGYGGPFLSFGPAYGAGLWLTFGCNWYGGGVVMVDANYWHRDGGWWRPYGGGMERSAFLASVNARPWGFPSNRRAPQAPRGWQNQAAIVHPHLVSGFPARPPQSAYRDIHARGPAAVSAFAKGRGASGGAPVNRAAMAESPSSPSRGEAVKQPVQARPESPSRPEAQEERRVETDNHASGGETARPKPAPAHAKSAPKATGEKAKVNAKRPAKPSGEKRSEGQESDRKSKPDSNE